MLVWGGSCLVAMDSVYKDARIVGIHQGFFHEAIASVYKDAHIVGICVRADILTYRRPQNVRLHAWMLVWTDAGMR